MPREPQPGGDSSYRKERKDLKELQLFSFAGFVVRCLPAIFSHLQGCDFTNFDRISYLNDVQ